jgi:2'-5' RNA ligase
MRLFLAVYPPPEALEHLAATVARLNLTRRVIPPDRWHITLAFLGDVPLSLPDATPEVGGGARGRGFVEGEAVWGALARVKVAAGEVQLASGGRFGQVVWAGVGGDTEGLTRLSRAVRRELRAVRVRSDDKRFRAHVTLARSAEGLSTQDMAMLQAYQGPSWPVREFVLVKSELGPHPQYHRLGAWPVTNALA